MKYLSFPIALGIHLAAFFAASYFIGTDQEYNIAVVGGSGSAHRNLIDVSFGSASKKASSQNSFKKSAPASSEVLSQTTSEVPQNAEGDSGGSGIETSFGNNTSGSMSNFDSHILSYAEPIYPKIAIKRSLEGEVKLSLKISESGAPQEIIIQKSSGSSLLDESAKAAALKWRFQKKPGIEHYLVEKTVVFKLRN